MISETISSLLAGYREGYDALIEALETFPREMWHYRPDQSEWTIHEIIIHITDAEINGWVRLRWLIAEPGLNITVYDQDKWTASLGYHQQSTSAALAIFKLLREVNHSLIASLPDESWKNEYVHPEFGTMNLEDWLAQYTRHIPGHINQMNRVYQMWLDANKPKAEQT